MDNIKQNDYKIALAEVDEILHFSDEEIISKIPESFLSFIRNNKEKNYVSNINPYLPLEEQDIKTETKAIISLIYRNYIATEEEKKIYNQKEKEELEKEEEEKYLKYNPDNIFKQNKTKEVFEENKSQVEETAITEIKENWFKKILSKIKDIILKKKNK